MKRVRLYHHPDCVRCRRIARVHRVFDWLGRVEVSTGTPPTGPLVPGAIALEDLRTGQTVLGVDVPRRLAREIPAYLPLLPLFYLPFVAARIDRETRGCTDGGCGVPAVAVPPDGRAAG